MKSVFKESFGVLQIIKENYEQSQRSLTTDVKIEIAKDCMKKVKGTPEYFEIEKTLKELERDYRYERHGVIMSPRVKPFEDEVVENMAQVLDKEAREAKIRYNKLQIEKENLTTAYREKMNVIKAELKEIKTFEKQLFELWYMSPDVLKALKESGRK